MKRIEKNITFNRALLIPAFLLFSLYSIPAYSQEDLAGPATGTDDALEEELRYLQAETYVITASRIPEHIKKTAASITVVTDKQIRDMGARNLIDVLETVPGWSNWYALNGFNLSNVRGIANQMASAILVMINSHPLNESWSGAGLYTYDIVALDKVQRIEFVRGPGSALYGANAFAGVINIITKEADDVDGWELSTRGGSYDTQQYNLLYGKTHSDLEVVFNYNYFNTHGFNGHVNKDSLSLSLPWLYPTDRIASLAPGRMRGDDEKYDASLNLKYKGLMFDGGYIDRKRDIAFNNAGALNNNSIFSVEDYYLNLSYERTFWEKLTLLGKAYRNHNKIDPWRQSWPPGVSFLNPLGPNITLQEVTSQFTVKNKRTGFEMQTTYNMGKSNTLLAGITYEEMKQYDVRHKGNFLVFGDRGFFLTPLPWTIDFPDRMYVSRPIKRNFKAFFMEYIWDFTDTLRLTVGGRYDDYSDFGDNFNPRAGLTWEFIKGYDLKLLYGRAFRAPSFLELSDPGFGNPDLEPEEVDTYQVSLGAQFTPSFNSRITWFRNRIKDSIVLDFETGQLGLWNWDWNYVNRDTIRSEGLEVEMKYDLGRGSYLGCNYRYMIFQKRFMEWEIPRHIGNIMTNIRLSKYLNFYASCHIEDGLRRDRGDDRDDVSGYGIVNTTLIAKKFLKDYEGFELRGSIYNLFDKDYVSPQPAFLLPEDLPRPGRSCMVEARYKF